jgi:mannosyl-glycoprotein endo-beta-N-acetylglucosaminidase
LLPKSFKDWPREDKSVESTKDWNIKFSLPVSKTQILGDHIYVTNATGEKEPVQINSQNEKAVQVLPPKGGYQPGATYTLWIAGSLESEGGKPLIQPYKLQFKIAN